MSTKRRPKRLQESRRGTHRGVFAFCAALVCTLACERAAHAQVHWDTGLEVALEKRFLTARRATAPHATSLDGDASFGPAFRLSGHLALLPLIRVGGYAGYTLSPQNDSLRHMITGGLEARIFPPFGLTSWRPFVLLGFGYQRTFRSGYSIPRDGGCFETPLGIGASYRVRKPFEIGALLTTRIGFACAGDLYQTPYEYSADSYPAASGQERFGLSLGLFGSLEL